VTEPLAVGLVGAGPWAALVHAPLLAAGPETRLAGVWARRPEAAEQLAATHGATAARSLEELFDRSEAVAFAVAPEAQPELAERAVRAGKAVLLEKPLATTLGPAQRLADAVGEMGVGSLVVFTSRFAVAVREFLAEAAGFDAIGGRAWWYSGAFLGGPFAASPWRQDHGALLDVGPHALDLIDAALGPVEAVSAHAGKRGWVGLLLEHRSGACSEVSLCCRAAIPDSRAGVELYGPGGVLEMDARRARDDRMFVTLRSEFAEVARSGAAHECDVWRGLAIQKLLERASVQR
jgi:predicted dehydrogenase